MKTIALILALALSACITTTNPDGSVTKKPDSALIASLAGVALDVAAAKLGVDPSSTKAALAAYANLSGTAALAQANLGAQPSNATVGNGSAIPAIGNAVTAQLPAGPLDQATVNAIFAAAVAAAARGK